MVSLHQFLLCFAAARQSSRSTFPATAYDILRKHCFPPPSASSYSTLNRSIHSSSSQSPPALSSSKPLSAVASENSETSSNDDDKACDGAWGGGVTRQARAPIGHGAAPSPAACPLILYLAADDVDLVSVYSPNTHANDYKSLGNALDVPWISRISHRNATLCLKEPSRERKQKKMYNISQKTHLDCITNSSDKKIGLEDPYLVNSSDSQGTSEYKSLKNVLGAPQLSSIPLCNVSLLCPKEVSRVREQRWAYRSSQKALLDGLMDFSAKKTEMEVSDSVKSCESQITNVDKSHGILWDVPRISSISHDSIALGRKEVSLERKQKWTCKNSQKTRLDSLIGLCAKQMGTDDTNLVFGKLRRKTSLKEYNAMINLCVEEARKMGTVEESLDQLSKACTCLKVIKERGFQLKEESYGPILMFFIDFGMVLEFQFFSEIIRDGNMVSLPKLAYYEMLLWIKIDDQDKIDELISSLALHHGEDKYAFEENYLLALCNSYRKQECLRLLKSIDVTKVSSLKTLSSIFNSLGKLMLEKFAEKCILDLKETDIGEESISSFIYDFTTSIPNLMVEDVVLKFKNLHAQLDVTLSSVPCEKLIKLSCKLLKVHTALNIVDQIIERGLPLTTETFNVILDSCEGSCEYNLVRRVHSISTSFHNLKPNEKTFCKLINMSVKMKDFSRAYRIIKDLGKFSLLPTVNMYNAIMAGYFRQKDFHGGLMVFKHMEDANVKPDSQSFSYLINNCKSEQDINKFFNEMKHSEVQVTKHVCMALINAYAACGQFIKAKQVISDGRVPIKSLNEVKSVLVSALASHGQVSDALDIYEEMKKSKCKLAPKAVICLIEHMQSEGNLDRLLHLLDELDDKDYWVDAAFRIITYSIRHEHFGDDFHFSRPIILLLKKLKDIYCNDEVARHLLFDEICFLVVEKDPIDLEFGWNMLQAIKHELGVIPSRKSLDVLLSACQSSKDVLFCFKIWEEYQKAGLPYNILNYLRMYQVLLALGLVEPASRLLSNIPREDPHICYVINACQTAYRNSSHDKMKVLGV